MNKPQQPAEPEDVLCKHCGKFIRALGSNNWEHENGLIFCDDSCTQIATHPNDPKDYDACGCRNSIAKAPEGLAPRPQGKWTLIYFSAQRNPRTADLLSGSQIVQLIDELQDALRRATEAEEREQNIRQELESMGRLRNDWIERSESAEAKVADLQKQLDALTPPSTTEGR